jgi:tetratricopeptide (TPR) repeat protein
VILSSEKSRGLARWAVVALVVTLGVASTGCSFVQARVEMKEGNSAYNTERFEAAVERYKKVIEVDPIYKDAYFNMGLAILSLYQPGSTHEKDLVYASDAMNAFKDYLRLDPGNQKVENYFIEICQKSNNNEVAIRYFEAEHRRHPEKIEPITILGNLFTRTGDFDSAIAWMQKRVEMDAQNPEGYYTIGVNCWARSYNHLDLSQERRFQILDTGLDALDKAISLKPDYFEAYSYKNLILRQKAGFDNSPAKRLIYTQQADGFMKKAAELKKAKQEAAAAEDEAAESGL